MARVPGGHLRFFFWAALLFTPLLGFSGDRATGNYVYLLISECTPIGLDPLRPGRDHDANKPQQDDGWTAQLSKNQRGPILLIGL